MILWFDPFSQVDGCETAFIRAPQKVPAAWNTGHPQWPTQRSIFIPSLFLLTPASWNHFPQKAARSH